MTDLENFRATLEHCQPGRILPRASFTPDLHERVKAHAGTDNLADHYGIFDFGGVAIHRPEGTQPPDFTSYWEGQTLPEGTTFDAHGVAMVPSGFYHFWGYISPLRNATSLSEIETYPIEDEREWDTSDLVDQVTARHAQGKITGAWIGHMYETAWQIRGYEQFLMDMVERPAWCECLLDRLTEQNMHKAIAYAEAGADLIRTGDDVANQTNLMFSPRMWRKFMLSRWKPVWQTIKNINPDCRIWYHSDGDISAIVEDLIDAGVDILNPVQPECVDIDALHKRYGDRVTFDGCIGTQSTMPFGTVDDVRQRVKTLINSYGRDGGLLLSPTHVLEPEVPLENIDAFFDACREYGTFM